MSYEWTLYNLQSTYYIHSWWTIQIIVSKQFKNARIVTDGTCVTRPAFAVGTFWVTSYFLAVTLAPHNTFHFYWKLQEITGTRHFMYSGQSQSDMFSNAFHAYVNIIIVIPIKRGWYWKFTITYIPISLVNALYYLLALSKIYIKSLNHEQTKDSILESWVKRATSKTRDVNNLALEWHIQLFSSATRT